MRNVLIFAGLVLALAAALAAALFLLVDPDDYREEIAQRVSATLGREVQLQGPLRLRLFPALALDLSDVVVGNPPGFPEAPDLARVGTASALVALWPLIRGNLEVGTVTLRDASLALVTSADGVHNLDGLLADPDEPSAREAAPDLARVSLAGLRFENVSLHVSDLGSEHRLQIRIDSLQMDAFRPDIPIPLRFRASLGNGHQDWLRDFSFEGTLDIAADLGRVRLDGWRAEFELPLAAARGEAQGSLEVDLSAAPPTLRFSALSSALHTDQQSLSFELGQPMALRLGEALAGQIDAAELGLNGQPLSISGDFALADSPRASLAVAGSVLDLRPFLAADGDIRAGQLSDASPEMDFSALVGPVLRLSLDLDRVIVDENLVLTEVAARAGLEGGVLTLAPLNARLLGGAFAGEVETDFTVVPPRTRIAPRLTGVQTSELVGLLSPAAPLRGLGELELDFQFSGLGREAILASLDGSGRFALDEGALLGVDLNRLIEEKLTVSTLSSVQEVFSGETPFRSLSGSIQAENGVFSLPDLQLQAERFVASGRGELDLAAGQLAYRLDLQLGEALIERLPRQLARATQGLIPLTIAGPLQRPVVRVDLVGIAEGALQRELQDRLFERHRPANDDAEDADADDGQEQRRARTSDLLLQGLRDRREREPPPDDPSDP